MLNYLENKKAGTEADEKWKVLYRKLEDGRYELAGLYDPDVPDEDYGDDLYAINLSSVYGGTRNLDVGAQVWNAKDTTDDPKPAGTTSWLGLWRQYVGGVEKCYVRNSAGINCNCVLVGGHMVRHSNEQHPPYGSNGVVCIIPICNAHNNYTNDNMMNVSDQVTAVLLNRYYQLSND